MTTDQKKRYRISVRCEKAIESVINYWFHYEDAKRPIPSKKHMETAQAWKIIHDELYSIEDQFYERFDGQNLKRDPNRTDWKTFAVHKILKIQSLIYQLRGYQSVDGDDNQVDNTNSDEEKQLLCTPAIEKLPKLCANRIWATWSQERQFGPRVGVILISIKETGAEKVLLVGYINKDKHLVLGFPKGRPNRNETIREGGFREFKEKSGVDDLCTYFQILAEDGFVIRKYPYLGYGSYRRTRTHYYVITTTELEDAPFRPNKNEIWHVGWHSIYTIPCRDWCIISPKRWLLTDPGLPIEYHMVTLKDKNGKNSTVLDMLAYLDAANNNQNARDKYLHTHRKCPRH